MTNKNNERYIDRIFREYGEEHFGKKYMDQVPTEILEESRCMAFRFLDSWIYEFGSADNDDLKNAFYRFIKLNMLYYKIPEVVS